MPFTQLTYADLYDSYLKSRQNFLDVFRTFFFSSDRLLLIRLICTMSTAFLTAIAVILCILFRILNVNSQPLKPSIWCLDESFLNCLNKIAPMLREPYVPTRLWGFSGHVQTVIHSIVGRVKCPWPLGERVYLSLTDGSTLTYDLYQPLNEHEDDITVAICPGIGNSSESVYIRTFVHYAQCHGYRCAVLNHIGALPSVQVTSSRIFTYGHTGDFAEMIGSLKKKYHSTSMVAVGFSLGGNLVTKYMGEKDNNRPDNVIGGISICQGYNAVEGTKWLLNWQNFRRFYLYVMTENVKNIIMKHRHVLLSDEVKTKFQLNEREIIAAATLPELDEAYTRKVHDFPSVNDMYRWSSSLNYLDGINKPMVFMNAKDDPLIPEDLLPPIKEFADDITVAICPGIGNSSESVYIRTFVHYAQCHGYRCAVLNHIGALPSVQVTSSRIFTYGHTGDFAEMIGSLKKKYHSTSMVAVGFSLGGNLVTKYMGEKDNNRPDNVIGGISICQGYNAVEGTKWLLNWQNFRRFYLYVMTENVKNIIMKHRHVLLSDEVKTKFQLNEREIIAAATLPELDEAYTRKVHDFPSVNDMYRWSSSLNYLDGINKPMVFMNAKDDPLIPEDLLPPIKEFAATRPSTAYIEVAHGGHLGFYEGGLLYPNPVTWLDRALVAVIGGLVLAHSDGLQKKISISS